MDLICSIHQPNFFPWLGYFDKIIRSDKFIFLDDVQFQKTGGTWTNRVKLHIASDGRWVTAAIDRTYSGTKNINEMVYITSEAWREKMIKTIEMNYKKHPFYEEMMSFFKPLIENTQANVAAYNIHAIIEICRKLDIDTSKIYKSSKINHSGSSNELLCSLTKAVGCNVYMCGGGASDYQDESIFKQHDLRIKFQNFDHPVYPQKKAPHFLAGLSIIDALMNIGWSETARLLSVQDQ